MDKNPQAKELIYKYHQGTASPEECLLVEQWFLIDLENSSAIPTAAGIQKADKRISAILSDHIAGKRSKTELKLWPRIAVAAAAVAAIAFGVWFFSTTRHPEFISGSPLANDIAPGKQGATLTLANGKKIRLADAVNGVLAKEAGVVITKSANGQLVYEIKGSETELNKINTLSTANGETYQVRLPDGSLVWLNAASSLTYSANLNEHGKRRVRLDGEAYFEITKDKKHPFIVESRGQEVEVLGTHFNLNSYADEPGIVTTLLEGSVRVSSGDVLQVIKPGEQALNTGGTIKVSDANTENIMDWKNGDFFLNRVNFKTAMRKIARWYDVEVIYDASVPNELESGGWISRDKNLSMVLKSIEVSGLVHFKVEGKKIYVSK